MLYKSIALIEYGIKPIWVFGNDLAEGVTEAIREEVKKLLEVLGLPIVQTKGRADAQCALLNKKGIASGVGSDKLDSLAYGAEVLLRHIKNDKKSAVRIEREVLLKELKLTQEQFIDLCVLCGTDYTQPIKGIAAGRALNYIKEFGSLKETINALRKLTTKTSQALKHEIPEEYSYEKAIKEFADPETTNINSLQVIITLLSRLNGKMWTLKS